MAESTTTAKNTFLREIKFVTAEIRANPKKITADRRHLNQMKDTASLLSFKNTCRLCAALESVFTAISDKKIALNKNLLHLILLTASEIEKAAANGDESKNYSQFITYCDKACAGEIFDAESLLQNEKKSSLPKNHEKSAPATTAQKSVEYPLSFLSKTLDEYEEMIARTYKIAAELSALPSSAEVNQIVSDIQFVQNGLLGAHKRVLSNIHDKAFTENHRDFHGFFVSACGKKYFISSEFIVDVTYESKLDYIIEENQRFLKRTETDGDGNETEIRIPVYALSSLFPEQTTLEKSAVDIILIAEYGNQKVGIVVEAMQQFASLVKKMLPPSFENFKMLEGLVFDENYEMIPILSVPEMLKKFRAQRGYEVKIFEANTRQRTYKILTVDDSETSRQVLHTILTANGFEVEQAEDGIIAIEKLKTKHFDLIVTDDAMPRMDGEILADNVRRMENYAKIPIIAMANQKIEKADAFISKSDFRRGDLIQMITEMLK